jgi:hypothetical protein
MIKANFPDRGFSVFLLVLSLTFISPVFSQITLTREDMPDAGDTIRLSTTITTGGIDYSLTGEDFLWDFSTLVPVTQQIDTFVSVSSTPFLYRLIFTSSVATIARPEPDVDFISDYPVTDVFTYFKETDDEFHDAGVAFTLAGIPLPVKYDEPDVLCRFPMSYGNVDSCESSVELEFPDLFYFSMDRKRKNTVDGWGTVVTPFGSFDVLRVRSEVNEDDSLFIDSLNMGYRIPRNYIQYKWIGNGHGVPLLQVDEEGLLLTVSYIDSMRIITSTPEQPTFLQQVKIYPNPATTEINLEWVNPHAGKTSVRLITLDGREIYRIERLPSGPDPILETVPLNGLNMVSGIYVLSVSVDGAPQVIQKFVYQRP